MTLNASVVPSKERLYLELQKLWDVRVDELKTYFAPMPELCATATAGKGGQIKYQSYKWTNSSWTHFI